MVDLLESKNIRLIYTIKAKAVFKVTSTWHHLTQYSCPDMQKYKKRQSPEDSLWQLEIQLLFPTQHQHYRPELNKLDPLACTRDKA
jgi:hypothetical protein